MLQKSVVNNIPNNRNLTIQEIFKFLKETIGYNQDNRDN